MTGADMDANELSELDKFVRDLNLRIVKTFAWILLAASIVMVCLLISLRVS